MRRPPTSTDARRATRARSTTCCTSGGSPVDPRTRCARALAALDPVALDLLRLACLSDDAPQVSELAAALELPEVTVLRHCQDLIDDLLLTVDLDQAEPATTRVRLAVLATLSRSAAAELHDRLAQALLLTGARPDRLVTHLLHARPRGNAAARLVLEHQGRRALRDGDTRLGVALLRRALDEGPGTADDAALASALARGLVTLGDVTGAVACWRQAGDLCADPALALEYAAAAADALADAGRLPEAVAAYAALAADAPPETRRWVHDRMLLASYVSGLEPLDRPDEGDAPGGTESISTAFALANKSLAADRVAVLARTAAQDALEGRLPVRSLLLSTALLAAASAFDDADRLLSDAVDAPRDPQTALIAVACRGLVRIRVGRVTEGLADLERAGAHPAAAGPAQEVARVSAVVDGLLARGDLAGATRLSAGLNRIPQSTGIAAAPRPAHARRGGGCRRRPRPGDGAVPRRRAVHRVRTSTTPGCSPGGSGPRSPRSGRAAPAGPSSSPGRTSGWPGSSARRTPRRRRCARSPPST